MSVMMLIGFLLFFTSHTASAASLAALMRAAGLTAVSKPTAAPDFQLDDVTGTTYRLRDHQGKVVFLNFWATWCPPCRYEMPYMEKLYQALRQQPFAMWAVNLQESRDQVHQFMMENGLHFPALLDPDNAVTTLYTVRGLPTTYLIDCAGNTVGWVVGPRDWANDATRRLLTAMLAHARCRRAPPGGSALPSGQGS